MSNHIDLQIACEASELPSLEHFQRWADLALTAVTDEKFELTIRLVTIKESQQLNSQYRHKDKPTNVLSFPFEVPEGIELNLLGDLVVCVPIVEQEAKEQSKSLFDHWAHMIIHGCLHLLGYDHISDADADEMEALEIKVLAELSIDNPYES
ncbi:MAG: putative rRNA maturation factor [Colwellia sp.]|jgi:probable rRNA maturation factor|tara:strand:+ start:16421 stop:16876 length:456 start_codon:yes stop_codon:yes gene_type:complete